MDYRAKLDRKDRIERFRNRPDHVVKNAIAALDWLPNAFVFGGDEGEIVFEWEEDGCEWKLEISPK